MDEYAAILLKMGELEGALIAAKQQISSIPKRMAQELITYSERLNAARYLYWFTDIPAQDIAEGLLGTDINGWHIDRFLERIGTMTTDVTCDRCHELMQFRSRQNLKDIMRDLQRSGTKYPEGYNVLCPPCWDAVQRERMA